MESIRGIKNKVKNILTKKDWKNISSEFTKELKRQWKEKGFSYEEVKEWIDAGLKVNDSNFAEWLKSAKKKNAEQLLDYGDKQELQEEYNKFIEELNELSESISKSIEEYETHQWENTKIKGCSECGRSKSESGKYYGIDWCQACSLSGRQDIDELILKCQLYSNEHGQYLKWIPYKNLTNIEYLTQGGFGKILKAKLSSRMVILKSLNNSQSTTTEFLQEVTNYRLFNHWSNVIYIVQCYGISQDPQTNDYIMVFNYMEDGNLRQYLQKNYRKLDFFDKLGQLLTIANGLSYIHRQGLVHRDFHPGNILNKYSGHLDNIGSYIADLGLSRPADEKDDKKVYGVLPYVAPEVLLEKTYTPASDIYSFGMIMYEILTGLPPYCYKKENDDKYYERIYNLDLSLEICNGLRPKFPEQLKIPQLLKDLIEKCWDNDPSKRPIADELYQFLSKGRKPSIFFGKKFGDIRRDTELYQQVRDAEESNQELPDEIRFPKYERNLGTIYTSKFINTKQITELLVTKNTEEYVDNNIKELDINDFNLDEFTIQEEDPQEQSSTQAQIEIIPSSSRN